MKLSFSNSDVTSKFLPIGRSLVRVSKVTFETSKSSGGQTIHIHVVGISPNAEGKEGKEIFSLSEKARWKLAAFCKACGFSDEDLLSSDFSTDMLIGKVFELEKLETGIRMVDGQEKKQYQSRYYKVEDTEGLTDEMDDLDEIPF